VIVALDGIAVAVIWSSRVKRLWLRFRGLPTAAQIAAWFVLGVVAVVVALALRPQQETEFVFTVPEPTEGSSGAFPLPSAPPPITPETRKGPAYVSRAELAREWPLTVEEGTVRCVDIEGFHGVLFGVDGRWYAVNGIARITTASAKIDELVAHDASGAKKDVSPLIERGLALCD
jgi:hypothetical protein